MEEMQPQDLETVNPHWYDKQWYVAIVLLLFWPVGLYGLIKSGNYKGVLLKVVACIGILFFIMLIANIKPGDTTMGFDAPHQSPWDNSVDVVEDYLKHTYLNDPDSYESIHWDKLHKTQDGGYYVIHSFRARNGMGGMVKTTMIFFISQDGKRVIGAHEQNF